jgi:CRP/FNR family cyclic AMP-dependent transcriptional regulator
MTTATQTPVGTHRVLEADAELAEAIPESRRQQAVRDCVAREVIISAGAFASLGASFPAGSMGLLVRSGLLIRRVGIDGRFGAELLGPGDVLRPWQDESEPMMLPLSTGWRVPGPARVAILDRRFTEFLRSYPELASPLFARAIERSRNLAINMAIVQQPRVDVRLHMLLWHLSERWGIVSSRGVRVPIRLTHSVLAELAAARRPTVTTALSELSRRGVLNQETDGWLLAGNAPDELMELGSPRIGAKGARARPPWLSRTPADR